MHFCVCRRKKTGKALGYLALVPASYLAGHLLVKGFTTTSYQMQRDFSLIILAAALIYAAVMLAINLWRQKREKCKRGRDAFASLPLLQSNSNAQGPLAKP